MAHGQGQRQGTAEGVADQIDLVQSQSVEQRDGVLDPVVQGIADPCGALGEAEADDVRRNNAKLLRQNREGESPVGPGGYAGSGAMNQQHRAAAAHVMQVRMDTAGEHCFADFGVLLGRGVHGVSFPCLS